MLDAGNYVVLDTDLLIEYNEEEMKKKSYEGGRTNEMYYFEERYLREKSEKEQQNER